MTATDESRRKHQVAPNGVAARIIMSFLATAGLFYANIMPALVDGLIKGLGFSVEDAGFVGSANVYGAAAGALIVVFLIRRINWRPTAYVLLCGLICMDLLSMLVKTPDLMIMTRFFHGMIGGALVGTGFAVIARASNPDRTFGVLLVVQFGLGGLGNLFLPRLVPVFGTNALFLSLIAFSFATLLMVPFLAQYRLRIPDPKIPADVPVRVAMRPLLLTLLAIFLFQAANMGLFAFIIGLAQHATLELDFITWTLALSGWIGIAGALLVVALHTKYGRTVPLAIALVVTIAGFWALHHSANTTLFLVANCAMGITWAFVIPYLLGLAAEFDRTGQMAALGGFASKMGLASGPMAAGMVLSGSQDYGLLINMGIAALVASMIAGVAPALRQDRIRRAELLASVV
ncbi:MAG TPA: MFS transporter [Woeseiaceae bacterium]|nr:MFS transporter [Woeseiaceae bacterium]